MEHLFSTNLAINQRNVPYRVVFDQEKYVFLNESDSREFSSFSFRREHDEWHNQELLPTELKQQAIDALEKYLLKQH